MKQIYIFLLGLMSMFSQCRNKPDIPAQPEISFSKQVESIIMSNCAQSGCHNGSKKPDLKDYNSIVQNVSPGNAHGSRLYTEIISRKMPPSQPLSDAQALLIYTWIMQGAKNN